MLEAMNLAILIGAGLIAISVFTSLISFRVGAPLLLVFLGVGLLAGEDGLLGLPFDNAGAAYFIGSIALAIILFDSGFETSLSTVRAAAWPSITLATVGVLLTTGLVGIAAHYLLGLSWLQRMLMGAIVSSTDAAAVFFLLRVGGITLRDRVRSTLEIESGSNDPMAIFLTVTLVELIALGADSVSWKVGVDFLVQLGGGGILGLLGGWAITVLFDRLRLEAGLYPVLALGLALFIFAVTAMLGGSGFLAVYVAGLVAGNARLRAAESLRRFHDGLIWLCQIIMFVTLGLLAAPAQFPNVAFPALMLAFILIFVARPVAVWLCLLPFRFTRQETAFVAWVGLRGAVSILLAILPMLGGLEGASNFFNFVFLIVVVSLLVQGWTIRPMARWLGLIVPSRSGPVNRVQVELPEPGPESGPMTYELVSYKIHENSPAARGQRLPRWARPSLIVRNGSVMRLPNIRQVQAGDYVYLFAPATQLRLLDKLFGGAWHLAADDREFFGDLVLEPDVTVGVLAEMYGLPLALDNAKLTLGDLFKREFRQPELGDRISMGAVDLIVRDIRDGMVSCIGLALEPTRITRPRVLLFQPPGDIIAVLRTLRSWLAFRRWKRRDRRRARRITRNRSG